MKYIILLVLLSACAAQDWYPDQIYRKNDILIYQDLSDIRFYRDKDAKDCGIFPGEGAWRWKYSGDIIEAERGNDKAPLVLYKIETFHPEATGQWMAKGKDWQIFLAMWQPGRGIGILYVNSKENCATMYDVGVKQEEVIPGTYRPVPHG